MDKPMKCEKCGSEFTIIWINPEIPQDVLHCPCCGAIYRRPGEA